MCSLADNLDSIVNTQKLSPSETSEAVLSLDRQIGLVLSAMESMSDRIELLADTIEGLVERVENLEKELLDVREDIADLADDVEQETDAINKTLKKKVDKTP